MILDDYKILIQNLPVRQQGFTIKRGNKKWKLAEEKLSWFEDFNDEHFNKGTLTVNRQDIFNIKHSIKEKIVKTIFWGYSNGMQGHNNFQSILANIPLIENILLDLKSIDNPTTEDFNTFNTRFSNISGLGLSTYSKLLYFADVKFNGNPSLILDGRLIYAFHSSVFNEFNALRQINYNNAAKYYLSYLEITQQQADRLETNGENIEQFLFIFGNNLTV